MDTPVSSAPIGPNRHRLGNWLRADRSGGILLAIGAALGLLAANSPWSGAYGQLRAVEWGPAGWQLHLSLEAWVADGLLAVFFFLIGLELKREFVVGELRNPRTALVPVLAAMGGVLVPALIFLAVTAGHPESQRGWAIPVATDIAFALAVLALIGSALPSAIRLFLLTLAVVDDLIGIALIAMLSAHSVDWVALLASLIPLAGFAVLAHLLQRPMLARPWLAWLLLPFAVASWALVHAGGIHPTIAGVLLGLAVPVRLPGQTGGSDGLAPALEHRIKPLSAGVVVPVFAFMAAGVSLGGEAGLDTLVAQPVFWGVLLGLVIGKPLGIVGSTWLITRTRWARLDPQYRWIDLLGLGLLAGIGFTVSLLIGGISFDPDALLGRSATVAVLLASLLATALAAAVLIPRNRRYRRPSATPATPGA